MAARQVTSTTQPGACRTHPAAQAALRPEKCRSSRPARLTKSGQGQRVEAPSSVRAQLRASLEAAFAAGRQTHAAGARQLRRGPRKRACGELAEMAGRPRRAAAAPGRRRNAHQRAPRPRRPLQTGCRGRRPPSAPGGCANASCYRWVLGATICLFGWPAAAHPEAPAAGARAASHDTGLGRAEPEAQGARRPGRRRAEVSKKRLALPTGPPLPILG